MSRLYDAVIVGAGPSGSFLAAGLAGAGLQVALVDRADFPRPKVCGGGLSQKSLSLIAGPLDDCDVAPVRGAIITYRNTRHLLKPTGAASGGTVLRSTFDAWLLRRARAAGAEFFPKAAFVAAERRGDIWHCRAGSHEIAGRVLVGADGVFSQVRRHVFGPGLVEYTAAVEANVYCGPRTARSFESWMVFDFGGMQRGYGWIFPKDDHLNVGVYSIFKHPGIASALDEFRRLYPVTRDVSRVERFGHAIPVRNTEGRYERDDCLLVGDAGGFAEAFYGEGIYYALRSADCARRALLALFRDGSDRQYTSLVRRELEPELRYSLLNAKLFFQWPDRAYRLLAENDVVCDWFAEVVHGGLSHKDLFWRVLGTCPYWLALGGRTARVPDPGWLTGGAAGAASASRTRN